MGRQRKSGKHLPRRMYHQHGSYFFVDHNGKWNNLGRSYPDALEILPSSSATLAP